jgi:hypothetical protein
LPSRDTPACEAAAIPACLRAISARHFEGLTLRRARNCRFSASLKVASYARRARASYRQAISAKTANAIGTAKGITLRSRVRAMIGFVRATFFRRAFEHVAQSAWRQFLQAIAYHAPKVTQGPQHHTLTLDKPRDITSPLVLAAAPSYSPR